MSVNFLRNPAVVNVCKVLWMMCKCLRFHRERAFTLNYSVSYRQGGRGWLDLSCFRSSHFGGCRGGLSVEAMHDNGGQNNVVCMYVET